MGRFDKDQFVADCLAAVHSGDRAHKQVKELVERAVSNPSGISAEVGDITHGAMKTIWHRSDELTVHHIVWPPEVELFPHDHNMWAVIGIYGGREDNQFYRRIEGGRIEPHTGKTITEQEVIASVPMWCTRLRTRPSNGPRHCTCTEQTSTRRPAQCGTVTRSNRLPSTRPCSKRCSPRPPPRPASLTPQVNDPRKTANNSRSIRPATSPRLAVPRVMFIKGPFSVADVTVV